jgi:hypothetical protein
MLLRGNLARGSLLLLALLLPGYAVHGGGKEGTAKQAKTPEEAVKYFLAAAKAGDLHAALEQIAQPYHDVMKFALLQEEADDLLRDALDKKFGKKAKVGFNPMSMKHELLLLEKVEIQDKKALAEDQVQLLVRETRDGSGGPEAWVIEVSYTAKKQGEGWKLERPFSLLLLDAGATDEKSELLLPGGKKGILIKIKSSSKDWLGKIKEGETAFCEEFGAKNMSEVVARAAQQKQLTVNFVKEIAAGKYASRKEAEAAYAKAIGKAK